MYKKLTGALCVVFPLFAANPAAAAIEPNTRNTQPQDGIMDIPSDPAQEIEIISEYLARDITVTEFSSITNPAVACVSASIGETTQDMSVALACFNKGKDITPSDNGLIEAEGATLDGTYMELVPASNPDKVCTIIKRPKSIAMSCYDRGPSRN